MTTQFIEAIKQTCTYQRKEGTSASYYRQSGTSILPERMSISREEMRTTEHKGRNLNHTTIGQIMATFKIAEVSPLKLYYPFQLRTNIWQHESFPTFIGYGTIGISNEKGLINRQSDKGDLIILQALTPEWEIIEIHYFAGMIMELENIMEYLYKSKK